MHSYTYTLLAFGALLLPASAIPAPAPQFNLDYSNGFVAPESEQAANAEVTLNVPACSNTDPITGQAFGFANMQDHCVNTLHASCVGVVTFPTSTSNGSGNPDNCGEACNCNQSKCGFVAISCGNVQCQGTPKSGAVDQSIGSCLPELGVGWGGCPCTVSV